MPKPEGEPKETANQPKETVNTNTEPTYTSYFRRNFFARDIVGLSAVTKTKEADRAVAIYLSPILDSLISSSTSTNESNKNKK